AASHAELSHNFLRFFHPLGTTRDTRGAELSARARATSPAAPVSTHEISIDPLAMPLLLPAAEALGLTRGAVRCNTLQGQARMRVAQSVGQACVSGAIIVLVAASSATAQTSSGDYAPLRRIGTTAAFSPHRPLTTAASLQTFSTMRGIPDDIRKVLRD